MFTYIIIIINELQVKTYKKVLGYPIHFLPFNLHHHLCGYWQLQLWSNVLLTHVYSLLITCL